VPSGHAIELDTETRSYALRQYVSLPYGDPDEAMRDLAGHARRIRARLDRVFTRLAHALAGRDVVITMSGGLDSSAIAALAREHLGTFRGITFTTPDATESSQSDLRYARMVAEHLGVPLEVVEVAPEKVRALVDRVLIDGQDYRDFNVHCGLVNAALADHLAQRSAGESGAMPVVLTGDGMNELVSDYDAVEHGGDTFYSLPDISPGRLRRFLVSGLDSGDREVGIFGRHGIGVIQPYLLCADAYTALPGGFLASSVAKQDLVAQIMGDRIPAPIYQRKKVRAQVGAGDKVGGTLAALVSGGVDASALFARFAELFRASPREAKAFIRGGVYRFRHDFPGGVDGD
jgi:asparagine synthetase B (glutamine-hydrolysing)